jgi:hypothetical protein
MYYPVALEPPEQKTVSTKYIFVSQTPLARRRGISPARRRPSPAPGRALASLVARTLRTLQWLDYGYGACAL